MGFSLIFLTVAFRAVSNVFFLEALCAAWILSITFQTLSMPPAATGRIVLAVFRAGFADIAVF
jgi:hypothetical protein